MTAAAVPTSAGRVYRRLLGYATRYWPAGVLALVGMLFEAASSGAFVYLIKPMLNELFVARDAAMIRWMPVLLVLLFVVRGIATWFSDYGMARVGRGVVRDMRQQVFAKYQRMPSAYFDRESSGNLISRVIYNAEQVAQASADALKVLVLDSLMVVAQLTVMLWHSASLTLYLFVMVPLVGLVWQFVGRRYRRINARIQGSMGSVTGIVEEVVEGHREVRIYGGQEREVARFGEVVENNFRLNLKVASTSAFSTSLIQVVAASALAAIVWRATRPDLLATMDPGTFMSLITAMLVMLPSIKRLTTVQSMVQRGIAASAELFEVIDSPAERDTGTRELARARGDIDFHGVTLQYPGSAQPALQDIVLECRAGTVTALVGRSGSGKSSLAGLLPRLYEPTAGSILLDGHRIDDYRLADLRRQIAWVGQRVVLFNGTIADNIAYGSLRDADEARIRAAAEAANAMEFIERLPEGLQSQVGERGALLSGGQRQRLAIARALLKDAPILVLDEATSALDTESERLIQDALARLMRDRTTLVIAHRLSTIEHADHVVVLDAGRIVEQGTHASLLARNGMYARLHSLQFGGEAAPA